MIKPNAKISTSRKTAFTLAEILITLGIIGVVAAITMPTLINNIQDKQFKTKWKKEYSVISNIFQEILKENIEINYENEYNYVGNNFSDEFIDYMKAKLNVVDSCGNRQQSSCDYFNYTNPHTQSVCKYKWSGVANLYSRYKALGSNINTNEYAEHGIYAYNFGRVALLLNDGSAVYFGGTHGGPWIVVDVNNFTQGPNEFGRDVFVIKVRSNPNTNTHWLRPMGAEDTFNKSINGEICECSKDKGAKTGTYLAGPAGEGEVISGVCCSAKYLFE